MTWTRRRIILVSLLLVLVTAIVAVNVFLRSYSIDNYVGHPQVVGLPAGYDPRAPTVAYSGLHPSEKQRAPDNFAYPIPVGAPGPVMPTYAPDLEYPYACRTERSGLGQPLPDNQDGAGVAVYEVDSDGNKTERVVGYSKDCSLPTQVRYYYRIRASGGFAPFTTDSTDVDIVSINGRSVPFIVRLEFGTINRHIYVIALLKGPDDEPEQPDLSYWNGKLVYQLRGGVGIGRRQGRIPPEYIPKRRQKQLRDGYAIAYSSANQTSTSYDIELAEDTLARVKRQFAARYGSPRYTIGIGGSGGAIQQYLIGQNRPGLLDGAIAMYSYPDMVSQTTRIMDCELLEYFFDVTDADNEKWRKRSQRSWIEGFNALDDIDNEHETWRDLQSIRLGQWPERARGHTECTRSWRNLTPQIANPRYTYFGSLFARDVREQVPWTYWDNLKRVYGTGDEGLAHRTFDNVGVQYGLQALKDGNIGVGEFLHLNDSIGGWKAAPDMQAERYWLYAAGRSSLADLSVWSHHNMLKRESADQAVPRNAGNRDAIAAAYRAGQVFLGRISIPVIDYRHYLEPELDMHHSLQSFSVRLRMLRAQGHADNQLIWMSRKPSTPLDDVFDVMSRWLDSMEANPGLDAVAAKPATATDRCYSSSGQLIAEGDNVWDGAWNGKENGNCMKVYPIFSNPRIVAGDDYVGDIFKCYLQSIDDAIAGGVYGPVDMSAHRDELRRIFPDGVCDYPRGDAARPADILSN